jgi:heterodisulfide reductase subunit B
MKYAYFPGCKIPYHLPAYGESTLAVCERLGIELVDVEFNCCGYPVKHQDFVASMLSAGRNFALAARAGLPILTPCKCCYGNMRHARHWLLRRPELREIVAGHLMEEGLELPEEMRIVHLLQALDQDVGADKIAEAVTAPRQGLKVAAHYGCHALRPADVTGFDNPLNPTVFERIIRATGAEPVEWQLRLECCGNPLRGKDDEMAIRLARRKLEDAGDAGADVICTACTYCQMQFDSYRPELGALPPETPESMLVTGLLGRALGIGDAK